MVTATEVEVKKVPFSYFMNRDEKLRADSVRRTFETGGLRVEEVAPPGDQYQHGDPKYRITATPEAGSLDRMLGLYQMNVATGEWPNTSACGITREPTEGEEKKERILELRLSLPDGRNVSAPHTVIDLVECYTGKPPGEINGRVTPEYLTAQTDVPETVMAATVTVVHPPRFPSMVDMTGWIG